MIVQALCSAFSIEKGLWAFVFTGNRLAAEKSDSL